MYVVDKIFLATTRSILYSENKQRKSRNGQRKEKDDSEGIKEGARVSTEGQEMGD